MNNIFEILKLFNTLNQQQGGSQQNVDVSKNSSIFNNYPSEAFQTNQAQNSGANENNLLPLIMSLLGKSDFSKAFSQTNKEEGKTESSSPRDEILL